MRTWGKRPRDGGETLLTRPTVAVIAYGANSAQNAMMACTLTLSAILDSTPETQFADLILADEWKNDPRNPNAKTAGGH